MKCAVARERDRLTKELAAEKSAWVDAMAEVQNWKGTCERLSQDINELCDENALLKQQLESAKEEIARLKND
jgi:peptidoglycan hydrolase CwlO-like protein